MIALVAPPGWAERVAWLRGIEHRAMAEEAVAIRQGRTAFMARQKIALAHRNLVRLMAMRPPTPTLTESLAEQCEAESARQRGWTRRGDVWGPR